MSRVLPARAGDGLEALAKRAGTGDLDAFSDLVVATSPAIYALALRLVGNEHDARDVVQETYLRAFRAIGKFRNDAAVTTWLYRICANCASTHLDRRRSRSTTELSSDASLSDPSAQLRLDEVDDAGTDRPRLAAALAQLAPVLRAVVVLHDIYDLSHEAIAAELDISRAASKVRLHRARRKLRELLEGDVEEKVRTRSQQAVVLPMTRPGREGSELGRSAG